MELFRTATAVATEREVWRKWQDWRYDETDGGMAGCGCTPEARAGRVKRLAATAAAAKARRQLGGEVEGGGVDEHGEGEREAMG